MPPDLAVRVNRSAIDIDQRLVRQAPDDRSCLPGRAPHVGTPTHAHQVLRGGNLARGLRASRIDKVPDRRVLVEVDPATRAPAAGRAAFASVKEAGIETDDAVRLIGVQAGLLRRA